MTHHDHGRTEDLERIVARAFDGVTWPVPAVVLAALVDLGLSDEALARIFHVDAAAVRRWRVPEL